MDAEKFFERYIFDVAKDFIGGGGFSTVYKAYDTVHDTYVAIKVSEAKKGQENLSLKKEVEITNRLPSHRYISNYKGCERIPMPNGIYDYAIMQYYEEGSLNDLLKKKLTAIQKKNLFQRIIDGLHFLHSSNIIHRDLKPENILIVKRGDEYIPKLSDFGLSKFIDSNSKVQNSFIGGSLNYCSPEQSEGRHVRKNTDIWSLGVIGYQLFYGKLPFDNKKYSDIQSYIVDKDTTKSIVDIDTSIPYSSLISSSLIIDQSMRAPSLEKYSTAANENTHIVLKPSKISNDQKSSWSKKLLLLPFSIGLLCLLFYFNNTKSVKTTVKADKKEVIDSLKPEDAIESKNVGSKLAKKPIYENKENVHKTTEVSSPVVEKQKTEKKVTSTINKSSASLSTSPKNMSPKALAVSMLLKDYFSIIPGGTYTPGVQERGKFDSEFNEEAFHVTAFKMGKHEVTQELWEAVMDSNPSYSQSSKLPVTNVSFQDVNQFLSKLKALTGERYRLPTEIEWEYAAADTNMDQIKESKNVVSWHGDNSSGKTHKVATKASNKYGLYDMIGNVKEWTSTRKSSSNYSNLKNKTGKLIVKGGDARSTDVALRKTKKSYYTDSTKNKMIGFRIIKV